MKALLVAINAKYIHSNLAIFSLYKYAEKYKDNLAFVEYTINQYADDILMDLYKQQPDMVAFSCYIWNIEMVMQISKELKKICPKVKIWMGGPEVSYEVKKFMEKNSYVDGVIVGEGEQTFLELMSYYVDEKDKLEDISGIAYRDQNEITMTKPRFPMDLSEIPFPYEDMDYLEHKIVYYETSRGCPFSCSYCLSSIEKGVRLRNLDLVFKELQFFLDHKISQVKFIDRTFNCNHNHAMAIWQYILEHDNGITNFHFEISADLLRGDELELLKKMRVGLVQLEIGVQSTNPKTIEAIHRTMDLEKLKNAVDLVKSFGNIHQHLDLIAGLPYEDYASFQKSFDDVYAMKPDQLQLGFLKVLKGSRMHEEKEEHGVKYKSYAPYEVLVTKWLHFEDVLRLKRVEDMVEVYYNSGQFAHTLPFLMHFYDSPFTFYQEIGDYYEEHGQIGIRYTRIARYDILLEFVKKKMPDLVEPLKEIMTYDVYLRENIKSRPDFASDIEKYKNLYHKFYADCEEKNKSEIENVLSGYGQYQVRHMARMTHIEHFNFDLEELENNGTMISKDYHVLFDYQNMHPLRMEAATYDIEIDG